MRRDNYLHASNKLIQSGKIADYCLSSNIDESYKQIYRFKNDETLITKYPKENCEILCEKIKKKFGLKNIVLGSGSEDLIIRSNRLITNEKRKVGIVLPIFYRILETLENYHYRILSPNDLNKPIKLDAVWLNNPNPFIGEVLKRDYLLKIIKNNPQTVFFIDEAAMFLLPNWKQYSLLSKLTPKLNCVVLTSFSKLHGVSGLRAGFASGNSQVLNKIQNFGTTFPLTGLTIHFIKKLLEQESFFDEIRSKIYQNKIDLEKSLITIPTLEVRPSVTNCVFCRRKNRGRLYDKLIKTGVAGLNLDTQKGVKKEGWVRLTAHSSRKLHSQLLSKLALLK